MSKIQNVLLTHGDHVVKVAETFKVIATSNNMIAAIGNDAKKMYGLQFHPEVSYNYILILIIFFCNYNCYFMLGEFN